MAAWFGHPATEGGIARWTPLLFVFFFCWVPSLSSLGIKSARTEFQNYYTGVDFSPLTIGAKTSNSCITSFALKKYKSYSSLFDVTIDLLVDIVVELVK